ncbi:hypothetical protein [Streptococcus suis]|uniref:hypothetical protein n=1 Tax=Streptococcus suis TaxID=1307 RepID=UPI0004163D95|nr:hypothetical protein [Streptococcus suis]HEM3171377.1 hypothetical protein [Streptococcus suis]
MKWIENLFNKYYFSKLMKKHRGELTDGIGVVKVFGKTIIFNCLSVKRGIGFVNNNTITIDGIEIASEKLE